MGPKSNEKCPYKRQRRRRREQRRGKSHVKTTQAEDWSEAATKKRRATRTGRGKETFSPETLEGVWPS